MNKQDLREEMVKENAMGCLSKIASINSSSNLVTEGYFKQGSFVKNIKIIKYILL